MPKIQYSLRTFVLGTIVFAAITLGCHWYFDLGHDSVEFVKRYQGLSLECMTAELGEDRKTEFNYKMRDVGDVFRKPLLNFYPVGIAENQEVAIKEITWRYRRYNITAWFHQVEGRWVVLDNCRWQHGVQF